MPTSRQDTNYYTLVQHSAYAYKGDPDFEHAVQEISVSDRTTLGQITRLGGLLFDTYQGAHEAAYAHNYPPGTRGILPCAAGHFANVTLDGQRLYIPAFEGQAA